VSEDTIVCSSCVLSPLSSSKKGKGLSKINFSFDKLALAESKNPIKEFFPMLKVKSNYARSRTVLLAGGRVSLYFDANGIAETQEHNREALTTLMRLRPGRFSILEDQLIEAILEPVVDITVSPVAAAGAVGGSEEAVAATTDTAPTRAQLTRERQLAAKVKEAAAEATSSKDSSTSKKVTKVTRKKSTEKSN